jgi:aldose sugar dehydrogenase
MTARTHALAGLFLLVSSACAVAGGQAEAENSNGPPETSSDVAFIVTTVAEGLEHPWGMAFLPADEGLLVTERPGRLRIVRNGELDPNPIAGVPAVDARGQGGLLDIALHPEFEENRLVYFTYSTGGAEGATTALGRARYVEGTLQDVEELFVADAWGGGGRHFGSRIVFHDGYLYMTIGDRGEMQEAQNLGNHKGTTLRLTDDGSVPQDNPFTGREDARDEIYTYGNRNAQGMVVHPTTGAIWQSEHGPRGGDEINIVETGANYGWPEYRYAPHYTGVPIPDYDPESDIVLPIMDWTPAIAPAGITFYTGDAFPEWHGDLFVASLVDRHVHRLRFDGTTVEEREVLLADRRQRIRDIATGPDGLLYVLVDDANAPLLRLEPASGLAMDEDL